MFNFNKVSISKLFEEELYDLKDKGVPPPITDNSTSNKKIAVVVDYAPSNFPPSEKQLLEKILGAVKANMAEVQIIHAQSEPFSFTALQNRMAFNKLIVFGLKPAALGLNIRLGSYQLTQFRESQLLFADGLNLIATDVKRKTYLWRTLQKMFEI